MLSRAERGEEGGGEEMKLLHGIGAAALILAVAGLEGGALSFGQAIAVMVPTSVLAAWSFTKTDWWEPTEEGDRDENCI